MSYGVVVNFCKGFIFAFITSQEPFTKIKTVKFLLSMCELCFNLAFFKLPM